MATLRELQLKQTYHKPEDDIARAFYLPSLAVAKTYDRAVGYFSSAIYALAWTSLREFVGNGGKIRMICSPVISEDDAAAMIEGYAARANALQVVDQCLPDIGRDGHLILQSYVTPLRIRW